MIREFYYGSSWHWPLKYLPRVMLSFNMIKKLKHPWKIDIPFMMDSGAYSVIKIHARYPYSAVDYFQGIEKWNPDISWTMDYPCEPDLQRKAGYNPKQSMAMTIENQKKLLDLGAKTQMVVQGWELRDYLQNLDMIKENGLLTERLGIGSVCRRGQDKQISLIIRTIKQNVPGWVKLHGFGIKISVLKRTDSLYHLHSADSQSWDYNRRYGQWLKGQYQNTTWKDKVPFLVDYINRMESYLNINQLVLDTD
jgi:hypothetical protein